MFAARRPMPFTGSFRSRAASTPIAILAGSSPSYAAPRPSAGRGTRGRRSRDLVLSSVEGMEERTMMSAIPSFQTLNVGSNVNTPAAVSVMENTTVSGSFPQGQPFSNAATVTLTKGELFTAALDVQNTLIWWNSPMGNQQSALQVTGPTGSVSYQSTLWGTGNTDPASGQATSDTFASFVAPATGTYTFTVGQNAWTLPWYENASYSLSLRPIGLDTSTLHPDSNAQDAAKLSFTGGGLYSWLSNNGNGTETLNFSGPTGRGFQVVGQFDETTTAVPGTALTTSTITSTGSWLTLETGLGAVPLPMPPGLVLQVTTTANGYNGMFGEVASAGFDFPGLSIIDQIVNPLGGQSGFNLNDSFSSFGSGFLGLPKLDMGLALGDSAAVQDLGLPLNPAVPYLYLNVQAFASASLGKAEATLGIGALRIAVDPADPAAYVDIKGLPVVSHIGFGISQNGYIPFQPDQTPNHFAGQQLFGDIYFNGTLNIAELTENALPVSVSGGAVINFDTSGNGWTTGLAQKSADLFSGNFSLSELSTIAIGVNGSANLTVAEPGFEITAQVAADTFIYNGPAQAAYWRGGTVNPFAGTPLAFLDSAQFNTDAWFDWSQGGMFSGHMQSDIQLSGSFSVLGGALNVSGAIDLSPSGISASGYANILGTNTYLSGSINPITGSYDLTGTVYAFYNASLYLPYMVDGSATIAANLGFDLSSATGQITYGGSVWVNGWAYLHNTSLGGSFSTSGYFSGSAAIGNLTQDAVTTEATWLAWNWIQSLI